MNISKINNNSLIGKVIRSPLKLIPKNAVLPIMQGKLKGKKWIKGSSINGCWFGSYEYDKQLLFDKYLKEGMTVYDIGSNVGFYTLLSSELVGNGGKVIAFEPFPQNLVYLKRHIELNNLKNVTVVEKAVSEKKGEMFFMSGKNNSEGHLDRTGDIQVLTISLDDFVDARNPSPDLIKMDIEGAEFDALLGAKNILSKRKPIIFLATHGQDIHKNCISYLLKFNYKLKSVSGKPIEETDEIIAEP